MAYIKWGLLAIIFGLIAAFFHFFLPSQDIVRVVRTETARVDVPSTDANGNEILVTRDQNRIYTFTADGDERVYRNEDTGWGFPWYFKFDTANLAAAAEDAVSTKDDPDWYVVRHYGWRITWWDGGVFPNALSVRPATGPDESLTPWSNIIFFSLLIITILVMRRILIILRRKHVDPVVDKIDAEIDETTSFWKKVFKGK